jgi:hypothetical protein
MSANQVLAVISEFASRYDLKDFRVIRKMLWLLASHAALGWAFLIWVYWGGQPSDGDLSPISITDPGIVALFATGVVAGFASRSWWTLLIMPIMLTIPWVMWFGFGLIIDLATGQGAGSPSDIVFAFAILPPFLAVAFSIPANAGVFASVLLSKLAGALTRRIRRRRVAGVVGAG